MQLVQFRNQICLIRSMAIVEISWYKFSIQFYKGYIGENIEIKCNMNRTLKPECFFVTHKKKLYTEPRILGMILKAYFHFLISLVSTQQY